MATKTEIQIIKAFVTDTFIETGKSLDTEAISTGTGLSKSKIYRIMSDAHGCIGGLVWDQEQRPKYEKNYGTQSGYSKVSVYRPSVETLRLMLKENRTK